MPSFSGQLNTNEIFSALYNMIISQQVFADNIKGAYSGLADRFRVDGSLYGDTKLYYATDALKSTAWGNDSEATNLLALHRPKAPSVQSIVLDTFRQISLTVDNYLSKRAFSTEGAFSEFNSVMLGWIKDTKKIYDATTINAFVGTNTATRNSQNKTLTLPTNSNPETQARLQGQAIAEALANLLIEITDVSTDFNDYGYRRSFDQSDLMIVWNAQYKNKITKVDLPTIFNNEGLLPELDQVMLPARYFGTVNTSSTAGNGTTVRSLIEQDINTSDEITHYFAGDLIKSTDTAPANTSYTQSADVIFKLMYKKAVPFMSAFEVGTSFFNPKSLTENHYLTWGHNTLEHLKNYPFVTMTKA